MSYHYIPIRIAKVKNKKKKVILNADDNMEKLDFSYIAAGDVEWYSFSRK